MAKPIEILQNLHAPDQPLDHTVLMMKLTALQYAYRRAYVVVPSSMLSVVEFSLALVSVPLAVQASLSELAQHDATSDERSTKCDCL